MRFKCYYLVALLLVVALVAPGSKAKEQRWVSLNQCVDQLLMRWAPNKLVGITYLSQSEQGNARQSKVQQHNGSVESVLALRPTRVIATEFTQPALISRLREYVPVTVLPQPQTWQQYEQWTQQLSAIGLTADVAQHVERVNLQFSRLAAKPGRVIFVMPNQWSWGANTWTHTLIERLGWENMAAQLGQGLVALDLETLIQLQPDWVVLEGFSEHSFALANSWRHHPLLQEWLADQQVITIDGGLAACPVVNIDAYLAALEELAR